MKLLKILEFNLRTKPKIMGLLMFAAIFVWLYVSVLVPLMFLPIFYCQLDTMTHLLGFYCEISVCKQCFFGLQMSGVFNLDLNHACLSFDFQKFLPETVVYFVDVPYFFQKNYHLLYLMICYSAFLSFNLGYSSFQFESEVYH